MFSLGRHSDFPTALPQCFILKLLRKNQHQVSTLWNEYNCVPKLHTLASDISYVMPNIVLWSRCTKHYVLYLTTAQMLDQERGIFHRQSKNSPELDSYLIGSRKSPREFVSKFRLQIHGSFREKNCNFWYRIRKIIVVPTWLIFHCVGRSFL